MKTLLFLFHSSTESTPQISWAIKEYLNPSVHQIILVFCLKEKMFFFNSPQLYLMSYGTMEKEEECAKVDAIAFMDKIKTNLESECAELRVSKMVIKGITKNKLKPVLELLDVKVVIMGPKDKKGFFYKFFDDLDDYLLNDVKVTVIRVPYYKY